MDKKLPSEIWIKIFMLLPVNNIQSVCDACTYWKSIVENYNIWRAHWLQLLGTASKTNLKDTLYPSLKQLNVCDLELKQSCVRLKNVLYDNKDEIYQCLLDSKLKIYEFAVLKTHYSKVTLTMFNNNEFVVGAYKNNDCDPTDDFYMLFREPPKLLETICSAFNGLNSHRHIHQLFYIYPLGMSPYLNKITSSLLESCHVNEIILIPRVLALCENLDILDGLVVLSGARSTEVALILGGKVQSGRWTERPVGGWKVAQSLHDAFKWLNPDSGDDPKKFETPGVKQLCWLPIGPIAANHKRHIEEHDVVIHHNERFVLKDELHLSAELMYSELGLVQIVEQLSVGLTDEQLSRCLSHVLLAGGNCQLQHLHVRVRLDLMTQWPQHAQVISTSVLVTPGLIYTPPRHLVDPPPPPSAFITAEEMCRITRHQYIVT